MAKRPQPCAVVGNVGIYALSAFGHFRCHGLVPWSVTLVSKLRVLLVSPDATTSCRGSSRLPPAGHLSNQREGPRHKAVASRTKERRGVELETSVRDHGTRPWRQK